MANELIPQAQDALQSIDDLVRDSGRGTENIGTDDVRPPRLKICQAGSPQRKPDNEKQIVGLQELDIFNDLSGEIYGRKLAITIVASLGSRGIQFSEDGKSVLDFDVQPDDPRMQFTTDPQSGKRIKPVASKIYDYLVWLPEQAELVALSMSSTLISVAIKLNGLMKLPLRMGGQIIMNPPAWARTYELETKMKQDGNHAWGIFNLKTIGVTDPAIREQCSALADIYGKKRIVIDHESEAVESGTSEGPATFTGHDM